MLFPKTSSTLQEAKVFVGSSPPSPPSTSKSRWYANYWREYEFQHGKFHQKSTCFCPARGCFFEGMHQSNSNPFSEWALSAEEILYLFSNTNQNLLLNQTFFFKWKINLGCEPILKNSEFGSKDYIHSIYIYNIQLVLNQFIGKEQKSCVYTQTH